MKKITNIILLMSLLGCVQVYAEDNTMMVEESSLPIKIQPKYCSSIDLDFKESHLSDDIDFAGLILNQNKVKDLDHAYEIFKVIYLENKPVAEALLAISDKQFCIN